MRTANVCSPEDRRTCGDNQSPLSDFSWKGSGKEDEGAEGVRADFQRSYFPLFMQNVYSISELSVIE